jgi:hypothetical protein
MHKSVRRTLLILGTIALCLGIVVLIQSTGAASHEEYVGGYRVRVPFGYSIHRRLPASLYALNLVKYWAVSKMQIDVIPQGANPNSYPEMPLGSPAADSSPKTKLEIGGIPFEKISWSSESRKGFELLSTKDDKVIRIEGSSLDTDSLNQLEQIALSLKQP